MKMNKETKVSKLLSGSLPAQIFVISWFVFGSLALSPGILHAGAGLEVFPDGPGDMASVIIENPGKHSVKKDNLMVSMHVNCFGLNLRGVPYPLSPANTLIANIVLRNHDDIIYKFPARPMFTGGYSYSKGYFVMVSPPGAKWLVEYRGNKVYFQNTFGFEVAKATVEPDGDYIETNTPIKVDGVSFRQEGIGMGGAAGGAVSGQWHHNLSQDGKQLNITASFPGTAGNCGSYYSPLMVFFDEKRPNFKNTTSFPLFPDISRIYWVEPQAPGAFLAYDRNSDGIINDGTELFGVGNGKKNGFEVLREFDTNHDNLISDQDKLFGKLLLWKDANGDGTSQKAELSAVVSSGILSFSLEYDASSMVDHEQRAAAREWAEFSFRKKGSSTISKGKVVDYWLAPAADDSLSSSQIVANKTH